MGHVAIVDTDGKRIMSILESMRPCIAYIDEVEKALSTKTETKKNRCKVCGVKIKPTEIHNHGGIRG